MTLVNSSQPSVLFEDNHLLIVRKPAGMLSQGDKTGDLSLVDWAQEHRRRQENKPGRAFVGLVHRLDRPVSGIVALAKTSKAAARITEQFRERSVLKRYLAVTEFWPRLDGAETPGFAEWMTWTDCLEKDTSRNCSRVVVRPTGASADLIRSAVTRLRLLERNQGFQLVLLEPITGKSHQLRVQLAHRETPIVGDCRYGSSIPLGAWIALHACSLRLRHPTTREELVFHDPPPASWNQEGFPNPIGFAQV